MVTFKGCRGTFAFIIAMILTCAPLSSDRDRPSGLTCSGMQKISAAGKSFSQGWNSPQASYDERPGMESGFTYNYWLDSTEVTQGHYYAVTGRRPVDSGSAYGAGDNYPVYRVSWFDAVLYCNARSRIEGFDTVYVYSGMKALSNGTVYELTGLRYDFGLDGYRLPTEAEWEYAAREGSSSLPYRAVSDSVYAGYYAWYGENSSGKTHGVATRLPNLLGLYDMSGNVFEWTNDWKCAYTGQRIMNSLGGLQPGREYEKVIKGGSYNYSQMYLRPSHRSATYATMLSSANEYVGFRCARGIIQDGQYIGRETSFRPDPVTIMTSGGELRTFIGTSEAKLVFVNVTGVNRTLCYVDFGRTFPYVAEYLDDRNVHHPTISPDGRYVAYCSRNEGQSGESPVSIRSIDSLNSPIVQLTSDSAYIPRWWINPGTGDTCIVYTNSALENNSSLWSRTKTCSQKISGGRPAGGPEELIAIGSYHDGISVNGRYAVTGFTRLLRRDKESGLDMQLFESPENGKDVNGSTQVCNVSISPDTGNGVRCMFLDFGYPRTSTVTGGSYGIHEYLFTADMSGVITDFIHCPSGEQSWDGVEWSNQPQFGVGCGRNGAEQAHAVYAIDLEGKTSKQLVTGTELQQPYLLSGEPLFIKIDSLGRYNEPSYSYYQAELTTKMLMYWRVFDSLEVAALGSSHMHFGFDPAMITGFRTLNMGARAHDFLGQKKIILNYILKHSPKIKVICSSLDIGWLNTPDGNYSWRNGFGLGKGYVYDSCHDFWPSGISGDFKRVIRQIPFPIPSDTENGGLEVLPSQNWGGSSPGYEGSISWTMTDSNCQQNLATITILADTLRKRGIHWIVINFPVSPFYRGTESYSYFGPTWQTAHAILQYLRDLETSNFFFHLYDANMDGNHDYGDSDAYNINHLCAQGAAKLSSRVNMVIDSILKR
jgi:uncharacterized protein (TIGR02171 family)